jgi:ABC-2 type transport system ATP-binding protein
MLSITTNGLTKRYGDFDALRDCSLTIPQGEVFGLLGPNGAGKTTLVRLLLGFIRPTRGTARIGDLNIVKETVAVRRQVAYLPGDARLPRHMKARELLDFFAGMQPYGDVERSLEVARRLDLDLRRRVAFMSTGMRQKLALAVVLGPRTPVLILDEPTANLDPTVRSEVLRMVAEARRGGRTVVFSSHVLSEIEDVCDSAAFLRRGSLVRSQRLSELRDRHLIRGSCELPLAPPEFAHSEVIAHQREQDRFLLDVSGQLTPVLQWLLEHPVRDLRIEPVRLKTVYDSVHRGELASGEASAAAAANVDDPDTAAQQTAAQRESA